MMSLKRRMTVDILFSSLFYSDSEFEPLHICKYINTLAFYSPNPTFTAKKLNWDWETWHKFLLSWDSSQKDNYIKVFSFDMVFYSSSLQYRTHHTSHFSKVESWPCKRHATKFELENALMMIKNFHWKEGWTLIFPLVLCFILILNSNTAHLQTNLEACILFPKYHLFCQKWHLDWHTWRYPNQCRCGDEEVLSRDSSQKDNTYQSF